MRQILALRKYISLSIAILLLMIVIFLGFAGYRIIDLSENLDVMREYSELQKGEYLNRTIQSHQRFLVSLRSTWRGLANRNPEMGNEEFIDSYIETVLSEFSLIRPYSLIMAVGEGKDVKYVNFNYDRYRPIVEYIKREVPEVRTGEVYYTEETSPEDNKILYMGDVFYYRGEYLYVYLVFEEKLVFQEMVSTLEQDIFDYIDRNVTQILYITIIFMLSIIGFGIYVIYNLRKFQVRFNKLKNIDLDKVVNKGED